VNESGVTLGLAGVETLQGDIEWIREVGEAFIRDLKSDTTPNRETVARRQNMYKHALKPVFL
jgi:hypothetical protein